MKTIAIVLWFFTFKPMNGPEIKIGPFFDSHACEIVQKNLDWQGEADGNAWMTKACEPLGLLPSSETQGLREVPPAEMADPYHLKQQAPPMAQGAKK